MASSGSEDEKEIQEDLWQHLSAYLDEQIGDSTKVKKKKRKSLTRHQQDQNGDVQLTDNKRTPTEQMLSSVSKVKELTMASQHSKTSEVCKQKQNIKKKVREILHKPSIAGRSEVMPHTDDDELSGGENYDDLSDNRDDDDDNYDECDGDSDGDDNDDDNGDGLEVGDVELSSVPSKNTQLEKFKQVLGISEADFGQTSGEQHLADVVIKEERVKTIALCKNNKQRPPPTVVVFKDRKMEAEHNKVRKAQYEDAEASSADAADHNSPAFDLKRARFEVRKFGISGLHGTEKEAGMIDLLVKLGAKPPKREYLNYKDLQQKKKEELEKAAENRELNRRVGFKIVKSGNKKRQRRDLNDIGVVDGQVGSYHRGVQVISKKHLQQLTNKKRKK